MLEENNSYMEKIKNYYTEGKMPEEIKNMIWGVRSLRNCFTADKAIEKLSYSYVLKLAREYGCGLDAPNIAMGENRAKDWNQIFPVILKFYTICFSCGYVLDQNLSLHKREDFTSEEIKEFREMINMQLEDAIQQSFDKRHPKKKRRFESYFDYYNDADKTYKNFKERNSGREIPRIKNRGTIHICDIEGKTIEDIFGIKNPSETVFREWLFLAGTLLATGDYDFSLDGIATKRPDSNHQKENETTSITPEETIEKLQKQLAESKKEIKVLKAATKSAARKSTSNRQKNKRM